MTFRHPVLTLRKINPEIYGSSIIFLKEFINIMMNIKVGSEKT